jgi:hypothetical protein
MDMSSDVAYTIVVMSYMDTSSDLAHIFLYNFNVCCQGEMRRCLVVQRHLCFQRKRGDSSTTNRALKLYRSCIEYTQLPRDHFRNYKETYYFF